MKRQIKHPHSQVLQEKLTYKVNGNNQKLREILLKEQGSFCAYTETCLGRTDKKEIDHFNPTLKGKPNDDYHNWFVIKAQWNNEKSNKWAKYQPVLHPTDPTLETRIIYDDGDYFANDSNDTEAQNLIQLIKLNDPDLAEERKRYISRKRKEISNSGMTPQAFFNLMIKEDIYCVRFIRAIENEFGIKLELYT